MWRAATWQGKGEPATRGSVECLWSAARHECDWRFEYGMQIRDILVRKRMATGCNQADPLELMLRWVCVHFESSGGTGPTPTPTHTHCLLSHIAAHRVRAGTHRSRVASRVL